MTLINEAIDRIAIYYASFEVETMLDEAAFNWVLSNSKGFSGKSINRREVRKTLSNETLQNIVSDCYAPRLSLEQIKSITKSYPFQLPLEIYDLYQRGNGCLPIGLDDSLKDWNSLDNYVSFSFFGDHSFLTLQQAMSLYECFINAYNCGYDVDLRWFPISCYEDAILAVIGSEKQEEASTVISFYDSDFTPTIEWSSLANMLFTWVEIREGKFDDSAKEAIHQKYGRKAGELYW